MKKTLLIFLLFFSMSASLSLAQSSAESPQEIYRRANLSYENGDYEKAALLYTKLLDMDKVSAEVYYNLGNSYFKLKDIGRAVLNYERAIRLAPRDRDIRLNLNLAKSMTLDKIEMPDRGFVLGAVMFLYDRTNISELTALTLLTYLLVVLFLAFSIFFVEKRKTIFYNVGALTVLLILFSVFLISKIHREDFTKEAVVLSDKVDVRSGPKEDYLLQFSIHEGTVVRVVEERQSWYGIHLSKDLTGWIPKDAVGII